MSRQSGMEPKLEKGVRASTPRHEVAPGTDGPPGPSSYVPVGGLGRSDIVGPGHTLGSSIHIEKSGKFFFFFFYFTTGRGLRTSFFRVLVYQTLKTRLGIRTSGLKTPGI